MASTRIMVLGGTGMLGHKVVQACAPRFATISVSRSVPPPGFIASLPSVRFMTGVDVTEPDCIRRLLQEAAPDIVVNCVGIVKQLAEAKDPIPSITVNALLPHQIAQECERLGIRLIHVSTDCVFRGTRGGYSEADTADADDLYGRTKLLGEVEGARCLTLRTSIVGRELRGASGLVEWFLSCPGPAKGYAEAFFSGLTTLELAELIATIAETQSPESGVWHVSSSRISKYELLRLLARCLQKDITIIEDHTIVIDRSLDSERFKRATGYQPPSWPDMIARLALDETNYEALRSHESHR